MRRNYWESIVAARAPGPTDDAVLAAMRRRRRRDFLPKDQRKFAGYNRPIHIGYDQTNSQPSTVADMLWLLDVHPGHKVLDVGAGSGWTTAILGDLVTETGSVLGLEIIPELADTAAAALEQQNLPWCRIEPATHGALGAPNEAPFDRILVSAEARHLPHALVEQLTDNGMMVITVAGYMLRVVRHGPDSNDAEITRHGAYRFVDLIT